MSKYIIVRTSDSLVDLERKVNEATQLGYTPNGGPFYNSTHLEWCQAMSLTSTVANLTNAGNVRLKEKR